MIAAFVIFLREGVEGSMIVAILLAYLQRRGHARHFRDVFLGVAAALVLTVVGGVVLYLALSRYAGSRVQTYVETSTYVVAAASMTAMTFWMHQHARTMTSELESRGDRALSTGNRWALGLLAFQSVGREGLETMVFTLAILFANSRQSAAPVQSGLVLWGGALGLTVALALALAMYRLGRTINVKVFFRVLGIALMLFAAGLLADVVENLQRLGWITTGSRVLWNSNRFMSESSNLGDVFHSLLGYAAQPTVLQALVWLTYLAASVGTFALLGRKSPSRR